MSAVGAVGAVEEGDTAARTYANELQVLRVHAAVCAAGLVAIVVVNLATNLAAGIADHWSAWWSVWAVLGWSLGVAVHGLVVRLARPVTSTATAPTGHDSDGRRRKTSIDVG